jgi:hypothetical protein
VSQHLATNGRLSAFGQQIHLVRGRFGSGSAHRFSCAAHRLCDQWRAAPFGLL